MKLLQTMTPDEIKALTTTHCVMASWVNNEQVRCATDIEQPTEGALLYTMDRLRLKHPAIKYGKRYTRRHSR